MYEMRGLPETRSLFDTMTRWSSCCAYNEDGEEDGDGGGGSLSRLAMPGRVRRRGGEGGSIRWQHTITAAVGLLRPRTLCSACKLYFTRCVAYKLIIELPLPASQQAQ
jgi:hypothetical protein